MNYIFIISDGTGKTAQRLVEAALTQFEKAVVKIEIRPGVRTEKQILEVLEEAAEVNGFIVYTIVSKELRDFILRLSRLYSLGTIDLIGPLLAQLSNRLSDSPVEKPGLFHELNKVYFQRIEAVEFAFHHDDGQRLDELSKAEIVLVGVSRTFKTPLSIYLAFKGWFVANVPIILGMEPPPVLFDLPPGRVFGLSTDPDYLLTLRRVRHKHLRGATRGYANPKSISQELLYAQEIFSQQPHWPIINVTNKSIEEIASEILLIIRKLHESKKNS